MLAPLDLLQMAINGYEAQAEELDKLIDETKIRLEAMNTALHSVLCAQSVLVAKRDEIEKVTPVQEELDLQIKKPDNVVEFPAKTKKKSK